VATTERPAFAYAREIDTAPGRLVPDSALVAAARTLPATKRDLVALREFTGRASRAQVDRWWDAIQAGLTTEDLPAAKVPGEVLPPPRVWADKNPQADKRLKNARAAITLTSEELNIPLENLLTPELLRRLAWNPAVEFESAAIAEALLGMGARPWQVEATATDIATAFVEADQIAETDDEETS
jgi:ribonuclease D